MERALAARVVEYSTSDLVLGVVSSRVVTGLQPMRPVVAS